jgi:hypothetical protein
MIDFDLRFRFNCYRPLRNGVRQEIPFKEGLNVMVLDDLAQVSEALASLKCEFEHAWDIGRDPDADASAEEMSEWIFFSLLNSSPGPQQNDACGTNEMEQVLNVLEANIVGRKVRRWDIPLVAGRGCGGLSDTQWLSLMLVTASWPGQIIVIVDEANLSITELALADAKGYQ